MKKIIVLFSIFLLTGCFNREKVMVCKSNLTNDLENYETDIVYKVYYKNNVVTKTIIEENYYSNEEDIINYFEKSLEATYTNLNELYGGYTYTFKKEDNFITFNTVIDYSKVNLKKMVKDNKISSDYVKKNNTITKSSAKKMYEKKGAICEE